MKGAIFTTLLALSVTLAYAQQARQSHEKPASRPESVSSEYVVVDVMPEYPGGDAALLQYIGRIKYPTEAKANGWQGKVYVSFIVDKDGSITDLKVELSSGHEVLDAAAIDHLSNMELWKPGQMKGEPVRVYYTVPISFKL